MGDSDCQDGGSSHDLAVVVVNHDTRDDLLECLSRLPGACAGLATRVLVVDNASSDGSATAVRENFPRTVVLEAKKNLGFARACNRATELARAPFVAFVNPDTLCEGGCLDRLVRELRLNSHVAAVGPRLAHADGSLQTSAYRFPTLATECASLLGAGFWLPVALLRRIPGLRRALPDSGHFDPHEKTRAVDFVTGACLVVRASAFEEVGRFDERFFLYYEEIDLCRRLRAARWEVRHVPEARAVHLLSRASAVRPGLAYRARQQSRLLYHRKYEEPSFMRVLRAVLAVSASVGLLSRMLGVGSVRRSEFLRVLAWCRDPTTILPGAEGLAEPNVSDSGH